MATQAASRGLTKKVAAARANAIFAEEGSSDDDWVVVDPPQPVVEGGANGWAVSVKKKSAGKAGKKSPLNSPQVAPKASAKPVPKMREMPPAEVRLAAKAHHRSNFFVPAIFPDNGAAPSLLTVILSNCEAREVICLACTSRCFMRALLCDEGSDIINSLWCSVASIGFATRATSVHASVFAKDVAFKPATWARNRAFTARCVRGLAKPAVIANVDGVECGGGSARFMGDGKHKALVVGNGRQSVSTIDIAQGKSEEADVDRFRKCTLRSSFGVHPEEVIASWPIGSSERLWCVAGGGLVAARPVPKNGILPQENSPAFQWLELPQFGADFVPQVATPKDAAAGSSKSSSKQASPAQSPMLKAKASPLLKATTSPALKSPMHQAAASPKVKPSATPKFEPAFDPPPRLNSTTDSSPLARHSVQQDDVAQATKDSAITAIVEAVWSLLEEHVLLLVREDTRAAGRGMESTCDKPSSARRWLQVWTLPERSGFSLDTLEPVVSAVVSSLVTTVDVLRSDAANQCWVLCGLESGKSELRRLQTRRLGDLAEKPAPISFNIEQSWPESSPVSHALLRPGCSSATKPNAVVGQADVLKAHGVWGTAALLPVRAKDACVVAGVRAVGASGFAACTNSHVYAFEVNGASAPVLSAVVALPEVIPDMVQALAPSAVSSFEATPYGFYAVMDKTYVRQQKANALYCLWPSASEMTGVPNGFGTVRPKRATNPTAAVPAAAQTLFGAAPQPADEEESDEEVNISGALHLRAWNRQDEGEMVETRSVAVILNQLLLRKHRCAPVATLALERQQGSMLAVSSIGAGVVVITWGTEVSPALEQGRENQRQKQEEEAEAQRLEGLRFKLMRLETRLSAVEKLQDRKSQQGEESLNDEQRAKLSRRPQIEAEIEQLRMELGWDLDQHGDEENESDLEEQRAEEALHKRREKQQNKCIQVVSKRERQKDRGKNREQKFVCGDD